MTRRKRWTILKVTLALLCVACVSTILIGHWVQYKCEQECHMIFQRVFELDSEVKTLTDYIFVHDDPNRTELAGGYAITDEEVGTKFKIVRNDISESI